MNLLCSFTLLKYFIKMGFCCSYKWQIFNFLNKLKVSCDDLHNVVSQPIRNHAGQSDPVTGQYWSAFLRVNSAL